MAEGYPDRIISEEEIQELKELLLSQDLSYPDYAGWVGKTIKKIKDGKKHAFGLFAEKLGGDGVIRVTASGTVELKNFYICPEFRKSGNGHELLEYIENYCIERGYTQIQVDAYVSEIDTVRFFLKKGFEFQSRGDFYGEGNESYRLVKRLSAKYMGEYDWVAISKWVMECLWGFKHEKKLVERECYLYKKSDNGMNIISTVFINAGLDNKVDKEQLQSLHESGMVKGVSFCFAPFFTDSAKDYANEKGVTLIDCDKLEELSGLSLPKSPEEVAGLIAIIKPKYLNNLLEKKDRVYLRGGGISPGVDHGQVLLFYVTSPIMGIKGYTIIKNLSSGEPNDIWKKYSRQSAFKDDEYKTYTEGKSIVTAYSFEEIKEIPECIDLEKIREVLGSFNHQAGQRITVSDWERVREII
ncbi:MAG: GNAT family N-acetyltransferase [Euryarchaeota archaeon]|nr:GNAT family N-acetyltransferase [Euryarchaeota archaeon]